jgi:hypothetical protein
MIKKSRPFHWDILNTLIILLLAALFIFYLGRPKPPDPYWFISYEWVKAKERGVGRTCIDMKNSDFDILVAENKVKDKNKFDSLIINNFTPISKKTYELCIKQP